MTDKIPHYAKKAESKLKTMGEYCLAVRSDSEKAEPTGGYLYFSHLTGRTLPTKGCHWLIEHGMLKPNNDGLFEGFSQTYEVADA